MPELAWYVCSVYVYHDVNALALCTRSCDRHRRTFSSEGSLRVPMADVPTSLEDSRQRLLGLPARGVIALRPQSPSRRTLLAKNHRLVLPSVESLEKGHRVLKIPCLARIIDPQGLTSEGNHPVCRQVHLSEPFKGVPVVIVAIDFAALSGKVDSQHRHAPNTDSLQH